MPTSFRLEQTMGIRWWVATVAMVMPTWACAAAAAALACDGPDIQTVLQPAAMRSATPPEARAYWLSQRLLQWPKMIDTAERWARD